MRLDEALPRAAVRRVDVRGFGGLRGGAVPVAAADVDERRVGVREGVGLDFVRLLVELECDFGAPRLVRLVAWTKLFNCHYRCKPMSVCMHACMHEQEKLLACMHVLR